MTCRQALGFGLVALLLLAKPGNALTETIPTIETPHGLVWVFLPQNHLDGPLASILVLADRTGPDGREVPYIDYLLAAGISVMQLGTDAPRQAGSLFTPEAMDVIAHRLVPGQLDLNRIGFLGFGAGGRVALSAPAGPVAALYPACHGLPSMRRSAPTLLLHQDEPSEVAACRRVHPLAEVIGATTHGWDHGQRSWAGGTAQLPHPDGSQMRLLARSDGWATQRSVGRVVRHFRDAFGIDPSGTPQRAALQ